MIGETLTEIETRNEETMKKAKEKKGRKTSKNYSQGEE